MKIRMADEADAEKLLAIYEPYVRETAITFEYEVPTKEEFKNRIKGTLNKYPYLAAEENGEIYGYAYASAFKERAAYDWAVETSIYVDREKQGMGIGSGLYRELEALLKRQHILNVNACIAYPNPGSISFHEKFGYKETAHFTMCGYKFGAWYDMIWMEKMLGDHKENPEPVIWLPELKP